jgi:hypothetical protein
MYKIEFVIFVSIREFSGRSPYNYLTFRAKHNRNIYMEVLMLIENEGFLWAKDHFHLLELLIMVDKKDKLIRIMREASI